MTSRAMEAAQPARIAAVGLVTDIAEQGGDADIGRDVPQPDGNPGLVKFRQQRSAVRIVDGSDVETPPGSRANARGAPQRDGVALDHLADCGADRLDEVIAGGQPVRAGEEKAVERLRVISVDDLGRHPAGLLLQQVEPLQPTDRGISIEGPACRA